MVLVVGGLASGKRSYVRSLGYADSSLSRSPEVDAPVLCELEELLRAGALDDRTFELVASKEVVICSEVGLGVVPLDAGERAWRELVGRTCAELAARADRVVRMVCGIPVAIKG